MGLFTSLLGLPDVGKDVAARNALVAKYTFQNLTDPMKKDINQRVIQMLIAGGYHPDLALEKFREMKETEYYGIVVTALNNLGIEPQLKGICLFNNWQYVKNPLIALIDAEKEIKKVSDQISKRHNITITLSGNIRR